MINKKVEKEKMLFGKNTKAGRYYVAFKTQISFFNVYWILYCIVMLIVRNRHGFLGD